MMPGTSITTHISLLDASMVAHMQDPFSKFIASILIHVGCYGRYLSLPYGLSLKPLP